MSEWISVQERLPEEPGRYLVMYRQGKRIWKPFIADYDLGDDREFYWVNMLKDTHITHWISIPPPPTQKEE